ncbi:hypothetical protein HBB04_03940 [Pseudomonas coronafaciens]|nr:hypothetical protein HBB04_03940 [Pseudomonas coronafaciens]
MHMALALALCELAHQSGGPNARLWGSYQSVRNDDLDYCATLCRVAPLCVQAGVELFRIADNLPDRAHKHVDRLPTRNCVLVIEDHGWHRRDAT